MVVIPGLTAAVSETLPPPAAVNTGDVDVDADIVNADADADDINALGDGDPST
jgi:hypothetical protein